MATATFRSYFLEPLRLLLPGCPAPLIIDHLKTAAQRFCRETRIWTAELDAVDVVEGQDEYTISAPSGAIILGIEKVVVDGTTVDDSQYSAGRGSTITLEFEYESEEDVTDGLVVTASLQPSRSATGVEDWIYEMFSEAIKSGAMASLRAIPRMPWTDFNAAQVDRMSFEEAIQDARVEKMSEMKDTGMTMEVGFVY